MQQKGIEVFLGGDRLHYTKWTLVVVGVIVLVMGIAGLPGVSDMGAEPEWHAILKIIIGAVAIVVPFIDKHK
jgi:O-antigen/teichoic acid export membrane protein